MPALRPPAPVLAVLLLVTLAMEGQGQRDPIENCIPKEDAATLCDDIKYICEDLGLTYMYNPDIYCSLGKTPYFDPQYICNCNILCVSALEEGEPCLASYSSSYPEELCGVGLDCMPVPGSLSYRCARNPDKKCVSLAIAYESAFESGTLGPAQLQPQCNDVGEFDSKQCSTSTTCYCTDIDGSRLFGEAPYTEADTMDCQCALHWARNKKLGLTEGLRCLANGNLDPLQCNEDFCFCYNSTLGQLTQGPYHPSQIPQMGCYDPEYHSLTYTNPCTVAEQLYEEENQIEDSDGLVLGTGLKPICSKDGNYAAIQPSGSEFICSDTHGKQIEDFAFSNQATPYTTCNCATRRAVMSSAELSSYLPECCPNGNYQSKQTRGLYAYCVDGDGNQKGDAVALTDTLSCDPEECLPAY